MNKEQLEHIEANTLEKIDPIVYYMNQMLCAFRENYFSYNEDLFDDNSDAKRIFVSSYQDMAAELFALSELMQNVRLKIDLASGQKTRIVEARLQENAEFEQRFGAAKEVQSA